MHEGYANPTRDQADGGEQRVQCIDASRPLCPNYHVAHGRQTYLGDGGSGRGSPGGNHCAGGTVVLVRTMVVVIVVVVVVACQGIQLTPFGDLDRCFAFVVFVAGMSRDLVDTS